MCAVKIIDDEAVRTKRMLADLHLAVGKMASCVPVDGLDKGDITGGLSAESEQAISEVLGKLQKYCPNIKATFGDSPDVGTRRFVSFVWVK